MMDEIDLYYRNREKFTVKDLMILFRIKLDEIEKYLSEKKKSSIKYLLQILDSKWYCKYEGRKIVQKNIELEEFEYKNLTQIKVLAKNNRLSMKEINFLINYFVADDSDYYCPEGIKGIE